MVSSTGTVLQEFRQTQNQVRQMSHWHQPPSSLLTWQTLSTLPILITLQMKTPTNPGLHRTYVNLKKANRARYRQESEAALSKCSLPTDCQKVEKIFRTDLLKAASHHIHTERHRLHVVCLLRPMEGMGRLQFSDFFSQNCQFHHRRLESLEHLNMFKKIIYHS